MTKKTVLQTVILPILVIVLIEVGVTTSVGTVPSSASTEEQIIGFKSNTPPSLQQAMTAEYGYKILARNDALNCVLVEVTGSDTLLVAAAGKDHEYGVMYPAVGGPT